MSVQTYKIPGQPYDGANISSHQSADGSMFFVYSGKNPDGVFKQQVARFRGGKWNWYSVPHPHHARPTATVEPDGLYITYYTDKEGTTRRWKVPDFVTPAYPSNGEGGGVTPVEMVDAIAREATEQNRQRIQNLRTQVSNLTKQVEVLQQQIVVLQQEMQQRPSGGGLTWNQIRDHLWNDTIIQDKVYLDLQQKGGIYGMIEALVKSLIGK